MDKQQREAIFKKIGIKTTYERLQEDRKNGVDRDYSIWHNIWKSPKEIVEQKKHMREQEKEWKQKLKACNAL